MLLEWPEHDKKLVEGLSNLHQLNAFHDVTLSAEGKQIKAHRVILASASTYFKVIIYKKSCRTVLKLQGISGKIVNKNC